MVGRVAWAAAKTLSQVQVHTVSPWLCSLYLICCFSMQSPLPTAFQSVWDMDMAKVVLAPP